MERIFIALSHAVEGPGILALGAAFAWGVLSILLSPCHLSSIPLIVGFVGRQGPVSTRRAFAISVLFSVGILTTIALVGVVTSIAGRMLGDLGRWGNYAVAVIFFVVGLNLLGVVRLPVPGLSQPVTGRSGMLAAFALGLVFGVALGPCTFAFLAPMLALTFTAASANWMYGLLLLLLYGVGHCAVIVLAGTFTGLVQRYLDWNAASSGAVVLRRVCGVLVLLGGVYLVYAAW